MDRLLIIDTLRIFQILMLAAAFFILVYMFYIMQSFRHLIPFVPTRRWVAREMVKLAHIKAGERIMDLGSGSGNLIIEAARLCPQSPVTGIERSAFLRWMTGVKLMAHPLLRSRIRVENKDMFTVDLRDTDVVLAFLTPEALQKLLPQFSTMKNGSRVVVNMFHLEHFEGFSEEIVTIGKGEKIFIYTKN